MKQIEDIKGKSVRSISQKVSIKGWKKLDELSKKNELSLSETGSRLLVQSMGGTLVG